MIGQDEEPFKISHFRRRKREKESERGKTEKQRETLRYI